jgi:hypothetical protein
MMELGPFYFLLLFFFLIDHATQKQVDTGDIGIRVKSESSGTNTFTFEYSLTTRDTYIFNPNENTYLLELTNGGGTGPNISSSAGVFSVTLRNTQVLTPPLLSTPPSPSLPTLTRYHHFHHVKLYVAGDIHLVGSPSQHPFGGDSNQLHLRRAVPSPCRGESRVQK